MSKLDIRNLCLVDFGYNLNKTRQTLSDVILQEGDGPTVIPTLAKKITSELAEVRIIVPGDAPYQQWGYRKNLNTVNYI